MEKKKLIIVYPNQFGYHTDSYKYCEYLSGSYNVTYICFDQGFEKLTLPLINIIYVPFNLGKLSRLIRFLKTVIISTKHDPGNILFVIQFKLSFIIGIFAHSKLKIIDYRTGDLSKNGVIRWFKNKLIGFDSLFFHRVSVISEGLRNILSLSSTKSYILPLGADCISTKKHTYDKMDMLYVGTLNQRNIYQTILGLALFLETYSNARKLISYTIIGFGDYSQIDFILTTIKKNRLEDIVTFAGRVKYSGLEKYFELCNIGIAYIPITPYYQYQPSTKTFEYSLSGLFTIGTNTNENKKIINAINGVLCNDNPVDFAKALEYVYLNKHTFNEEKIRFSLTEFQWRTIVEKFLLPILCK